MRYGFTILRKHLHKTTHCLFYRFLSSSLTTRACRRPATKCRATSAAHSVPNRRIPHYDIVVNRQQGATSMFRIHTYEPSQAEKSRAIEWKEITRTHNEQAETTSALHSATNTRHQHYRQVLALRFPHLFRHFQVRRFSNSLFHSSILTQCYLLDLLCDTCQENRQRRPIRTLMLSRSGVRHPSSRHRTSSPWHRCSRQKNAPSGSVHCCISTLSRIACMKTNPANRVVHTAAASSCQPPVSLRR